MDKLRRSLYHSKLYEEQRDVIKGVRWLLLRNGEDIKTDAAKKQLEEALKMNEPLAKAYYLKEKITLVWGQLDKGAAKAWLYDWIREAIRSEVMQLVTRRTVLPSEFRTLALEEPELASLQCVSRPAVLWQRGSQGHSH